MNNTLIYSVYVMAVLICSAGCSSPGRNDFQAPPVNTAKQWTDRPFKNDPDEYQFAIVGDRTGGERPDVFNKAIRMLNLLQPEFVLCVGDLIEGKTDNREVLNKQHEDKDRLLDSLEMRFFKVAGNHEIENKTMDEVYRQRYGTPYYHFVYKDTLFLIVCTEDNISDAQVKYMENAIKENSKVRWTIVFMHKPLFKEQGAKPHEGWGKIEKLLEDRPYSVFAGHEHTYATFEKRGHKYIQLATTGGASEMSGVAAGKFDHIIWVTMTDKGPRIANLLLNGMLPENARETK